MTRWPGHAWQVSTDVEGKNTWIQCLSVDGVRLPTGYYFGVSAATGDLTGQYVSTLGYWVLCCKWPKDHFEFLRLMYWIYWLLRCFGLPVYAICCIILIHSCFLKCAYLVTPCTICFLLSISVLTCVLEDYPKSTALIFTKFCGKVVHRPRKKP